MDFRYLWVPMPWAQGAGRSNRPAPTKLINRFREGSDSGLAHCDVTPY